MIDAEDLDRFLEAPLAEQIDAVESTLAKLEDKEFEIIDAACKKIVPRLRYANIKQRIEYNDGLELLAKLGIFLSLMEQNGKKDDEHG